MRRRTFLASATTALPVAVAGCASPTEEPQNIAEAPDGEEAHRGYAARLHMNPGDDARLGQYFVRGWHDTYRHARNLVISRAIENGETTVEGEIPPVRERRPVRFHERVYRISYEVVDVRPATRYFWHFDPVDEAPDDETVRFEDLPELDKEKFRLAGLEDGSAGEKAGLNVGRTFKYADEDRGESALVPTPDTPIIVWGPDRKARFTIHNSNSDNATVKTYLYTAEQLASGVEEYGQHLREQYAFELARLSDDERDIVEEARQKHGFFVIGGNPVPDAFLSLAEKIAEHEAVFGFDGVSGDYIASYAGEIHSLRLTYRENNAGETETKTA